jgi:hypothetical protein
MGMANRRAFLGSAKTSVGDYHAKALELRQFAHDLHLEINQHRNTHAYALGIMGLSLDPLVQAANAAEGAVTSFAGKALRVRGNADEGTQALLRETAQPLNDAIGEFDHQLALVRARINEIHEELGQ